MSEVVMYIIVNSDLKMSKGKIAAQVAHSAVKAAHVAEHETPWLFDEWYGRSHTKIILKATEQQMRDLIKVRAEYWDITPFTYTIDEGRTQIEAGSLTTIAFAPMFKENTPDVLKELKLL